MDVGVFLVDLLPPRIKDVTLKYLTGAELNEYRVGLAEVGAPLVPIAPEEARKLLHEVEARGRRIGLPSHEDYRAVEALFGTVDASASDAVFRFDTAGVLGLVDPDAPDTAAEGEGAEPPTIEHETSDPPPVGAAMEQDDAPRT